MKKTYKMRGSKTHGYGGMKKHRGGGSRGGRGLTGMKGHKKVWFRKNMPNRLGKRGFNSLSQRGIKEAIKSINLRDLQKLSNEKEIDASKLGYDKILGAGTLTKAITIKAKYFSEKAKEKIKNAKGKAIIIGENSEKVSKV